MQEQAEQECPDYAANLTPSFTIERRLREPEEPAGLILEVET